MDTVKQQSLLKRLWARVREYLTHWFVAGMIVAFSGFAPDHWVASLFHSMHAERLLDSIQAIDYRLLTVVTGVAVATTNIIVHKRRERKKSAAFPFVTEEAPGIAPPVSEETDGVKDRPSIAVLPFVNISGDQDHEYFADGITDDIINRLSCENRLFVIARNSMFAYKGQSPDIRAVGKELGVRYVLEGSVRIINDRLRINAQLAETAGATHVWVDNIDRPMKELFDIADDVANSLVAALISNLGVAEAKRTARQRPEDLQAWALSVQAETTYLLHPSAESLTAAEKLLRRAIEIEPGYGVSWAFHAYLTSVKNTCGLSANPASDADEALFLANEALKLAPNEPLVLGYSGVAYTWAGQTARAIGCLERSLEINPNSGICRLFYGAALWADGKPEAGIEQLNLFLRHSPKDPNIGFAHHFFLTAFSPLTTLSRRSNSPAR